MPVHFGRPEAQFTVRDMVKDESELSHECMELRSSSASWLRSKMMLNEQGASRIGNSVLVSSSTEPHLELVIGEHLWKERERESVSAV